VEPFGDRFLALHCEDLRLLELNSTSAYLLARLDGRKALSRIAADMAKDFGQPFHVVLSDLREATARMVELGLVERATPVSGNHSV
jgi:hypothetical protein